MKTSPSLKSGLIASLHRARDLATTVRGRLALLYGSILLASGAVLLAITYVLVDDALPPGVKQAPAKLGISPGNKPNPQSLPTGLNLEQVQELKDRLKAAEFGLVTGQRTADLHSLLVGSGIALGVMTLVSIVLGWAVAGRVLRPLRTIANATRQISEESLDRRLALKGPPDELRDLGGTIDGLLARLQSAFDGQRNFVANAAHELRTPLTVERALLQVALADPGITLDSLRAACDDVLENGRHLEELLEALLTLARSQRGLDRKEAVDLALIVSEAAASRTDAALAAGLRLDVTLGATPVLGDRALVERLVANLLDNAIHYNRVGGTVRIVAEDDADDTLLIVANTGVVVPEEQVGRLFEPFERTSASRTGEHEGLGLGLSIVQAIAKAHGARLVVSAGESGGLIVEVRFPPKRTDGLGVGASSSETNSTASHSHSVAP